ncbi:hypothetical protein F2Q70_00020769 [Brassica cretica]|uniref:Uncharacterized protein n=1 Tax=Brassica cretica TaxID=69181 RepID=A0A8S9GXF6_BRACR|nr:hypothetical protein F2Q70_00020769 [Brassica cretica]
MSKRFFKLLFPPPPPARRIIMRRHGSVKRKGAAWVWIRSGDSPRVSLEIMRSVRLFVKREVKILKTLSGHDNLLISMKHMRIIMMSILRWKAEVHRGGCKDCYHTKIECGCILLSPRCCTSISPTSDSELTSGTSSHRNLKKAALILTSMLPTYALLFLNNEELEALSNCKYQSHVMQVGISTEDKVLDSLVWLGYVI